MNIRMSAAGALALGAILAGSAWGAAAASPDEAQIQSLEKQFAAAVQTKDVAKIMAFYAPEGLFVFDVTPPRQYVGWPAYKKDWEGLFAGFSGPVKFSVSDVSVTAVGTVAYGHSIQSMNWTAKGKPAGMVVRVTDVWRKIGGKWLVVQEHISVPVDLDTGKPDMMSKP
jgi:ketosteroid isomerase-like protein